MSRPSEKRYDLVESFDALALAGKNPSVDKRLPDAPRLVVPQRFDLVENFGALSLAGRNPSVDKRFPDAPRLVVPPENTFFGGFNPRLLTPHAAPDNHRRAPLPLAANRNVGADLAVISQRKQSLTMEYALKFPIPNTPAKSALAPPFVIFSPLPHSDSVVSPKVASTPPLSAVNALTQPTLIVTPNRPSSVSVTFPAVTLSPGKSTARCSGTTRAGKQCSRQVKLPATHSRLDPIPVLYCHQHKDALFSQSGFYVRRAGHAEKFVEFSHYIPEYLQMDTQLALRVEMEKATSSADVPGFIYTFEIRDPKRTDVIQLKVGRAVNLHKRLVEWDKQCGSKVQIPRGWWPGTVEDDDGAAGSLLKGNIKAGDPGPFCHRVERLVHIELADLSLHAPYLNTAWPDVNGDPTPSTGSTNSSKKREDKCPDCGVAHKEIFAFPRPEQGRYKGKEWDLIVKPIIEKWGRFVKDYYA